MHSTHAPPRLPLGKMSSVSREPQSEQEVIDIYQRMRTEVNNIWQKINELEMELQEHGLVLQTLDPLEKDRKCAIFGRPSRSLG